MTAKPKRRHDPSTDLSDRVCEVVGCRKRIKQRMVDRCDAKVCYANYVAAKDYGVKP